MSDTSAEHLAFLTRCRSALGRCTFVPGSWDKRFVHNLPSDIRTTTDRQRYFIVFLTKRYRRQIKDKDLVLKAEEWLHNNTFPA